MTSRPGLNKAQLADSLSRHFHSLPVVEKEAITYFLYMIKVQLIFHQHFLEIVPTIGSRYDSYHDSVMIRFNLIVGVYIKLTETFQTGQSRLDSQGGKPSY